MAQRQWRSDDTVKWTYGFGNGSDGDLTISSNTTEAPIDSSCSGTAAASTLSATNASFASGQLILIHQSRGTGAGNWELNKIASYVAGTITTEKVLQNTYTDSGASQAQVRVLPQYDNVTINSGITYYPKNWDKNVGGILAFFAKTSVTITGTINATGANAGSGFSGSVQGKGFRGGNPKPSTGGGVGGYGYRGEGYPADTSQGQSANGNGGGGAYVANASFSHAAGGGGGNGTAGGSGSGNKGSSTSGAGGSTAGNAALTSMVFGGGGGGGGTDGGAICGPGGTGGGIIMIFASDITITGSIVANGGNGHANYTGGGGGAGGSILLKAVTATLGTTKITATGGSGGVTGNADGGNGGVGRIHLDYSGEYTGTTTPALDASLDPSIKGGALGMIQAMQMLMMQ